MALTNATTLADYGAGIGTQGATLKVDATNKRVGVGTDSPAGPEGSLQVGTGITFFGNTGIVSAIGGKFSGDFTVGGTLTYEDVANIDAVGIITAQSAVSIADSIFHTGDTDTSIRFPSAGTFTVSTNGTEAARVDSSQRLLVNIDSAMETFGSAALQVATTAGGTLVLGRNDTSVSADNGLGAIYFDTKAGGSYAESAVIAAESDADQGSGDYPSRLVFKTTADGASSVTERLRITSAGNMGLGTNNPTSDGGVTFEIYNATTPTLRLNDGGEYKALFQLRGNDLEVRGSNGVMEFYTGNADGASSTERMRIDSSGFITQKFTSNNSTTAEGLFINNLNNGTGNNASLIFSNDSGERKKAAIALIDTGNYGAGDLVFALDGADSGALNLTNDEKLRIDLDGRLLVGHTSNAIPYVESKIQVSATDSSGAVSIARYQNSASNPYLALVKSRGGLGNATIVQSGDGLGYIAFVGADGNDLTSEGAAITAEVDGTPGQDDMPGRLIFKTTADGSNSATERLRIASNGKISQGGHTPSYEYDLRGTGLQSILIGSEDAGGAMLILDGDSNGDGSGSDYASILHSTSGNIEINNRKAGSIIFKNTSSETERMRVDSAGRIQMGDRSGNNATHTSTAQVNIAKEDDIATSFSKAACYLHLGNAESTLNGLYPIGFGFSTNERTHLPAYIAYLTEDSGSGEHGPLIFATRNVTTDTAPSERMRVTSDGALQVGSSGSGALTNNALYESLRIGNGLIKKYYVIDTLDNGQKTRFTFTGTNRTSAIITIMASGSWTASNTANNHPAAQFISRVMTNSSGDSTDSSTVTTPFAYTYSTSNYAFNNAGSFGYSIEIANPTGDSGVTFSYEVTVQSSVASSQHTLASTTTA